MTSDLSVPLECISPLPEGPIWLSSGSIPPSVNIALQPGMHHVIQFRSAPSDADLKALSTLGIELLGAVPERAFFARVDVNAKLENPAALPIAGGIAQAFALEPAMKLHPALVAGPQGGPAWKQGSAAVHWFADTSADMREKSLANVGLKALQHGGMTDVVEASLDDLVALSGIDSVQFVEPFVRELRTHSHAGEVAHNASALYAPPYDITGEGLSVAVFDNGWIDWDHPDLAGRVFHDPSLLLWAGMPVAGSAYDAKQSHATGMAGIIGSSGAGNPAARGTVPAVRMYSYVSADFYQDPIAMMASESALHGFHAANHSYGSGFPCSPPNEEPCKSDPRWTGYILASRWTDVWAMEDGVLSVYSAGNDGLRKEGSYPAFLDDNWRTIYSGGTGKNALSVCAGAPTYGRGIEFSVRPDSSKGPASDGRVKPDLCALGDPVPTEPTMTTALGGGYRTTHQTSPAAAEVTGAVVALQSQYARMLPDDPAMPPALAKGLLLHTAREMDGNTARWNGSTGTYDTAHTTPGPDYTTGWGFMDLGAAFDALVNWSWQAGAIRAEAQSDYVIRSVAPGEEVRITLIWDDPASSPGISRALITDLDLRVTDLDSGAQHLPFVLDPMFPMLPASHGVNRVDNVEQVRFVNEGRRPADFLIEVVGTDVPVRTQQYFIISDHALHRPLVVADEYRLRRILEANQLAQLGCMGLVVQGPELELARRISVTFSKTERPVVTPFVPLLGKTDLDLVPLGSADPEAADRWPKLLDALNEAGSKGTVLTQARGASGAGAPIAVEVRGADAATKAVRVALALDQLRFE